VLHPNIKGIANKRNYILGCCHVDKLVILDDDLTFAARRDDEPTKFEECKDDCVLDLFKSIKQVLDVYVHGAVATREGGNYDTNVFKYNSRALRAHFFRADILHREGFHLNGTDFMSDFDSTLTMLRRGWSNIIINSWVTNQSGSNSVGGCSEYRTKGKLADAAHILHARHPKFVTVVQKETKSSWGGGIRTDVRIQWKKARESAKEDRNV
jgi:hypothetical protein